jgi:uncharacterized membrane protein
MTTFADAVAGRNKIAKMTKKARNIGIIIVLILAGVAAWYFLIRKKNPGTVDPANIPGGNKPPADS